MNEALNIQSVECLRRGLPCPRCAACAAKPLLRTTTPCTDLLAVYDHRGPGVPYIRHKGLRRSDGRTPADRAPRVRRRANCTGTHVSRGRKPSLRSLQPRRGFDTRRAASLALVSYRALPRCPRNRVARCAASTTTHCATSAIHRSEIESVAMEVTVARAIARGPCERWASRPST